MNQEPPVVTIDASRRRWTLDAGPKEWVLYRDLFWVLVTRDVRVRYKQTVFGAAWALLQPLVLMAVFSIFLGRLAKVPSAGVAYPIFALTGLVPWTFFAQGLSSATASLVENERLVTKIYFPRVFLPTTAAASYFLDFAIANVVLLSFALFYDVDISAKVLFLPVLGLAVFVAVLALGVGLSALNVRYRDVRYAIPFALQVLLFITPVVYPATLVHGGWRYVYALNPMSSVVELYRWALLDTPALPLPVLMTSVAATFVLLAFGVGYFSRVQQDFADVI